MFCKKILITVVLMSYMIIPLNASEKQFLYALQATESLGKDYVTVINSYNELCANEKDISIFSTRKYLKRLENITKDIKKAIGGFQYASSLWDEFRISASGDDTASVSNRRNAKNHMGDISKKISTLTDVIRENETCIEYSKRMSDLFDR